MLYNKYIMSKYYPIIDNYNLVYTDIHEEIEKFNDDYINAKITKVEQIITTELNNTINNEINNQIITKTPTFIQEIQTNLILDDINKMFLQKELTDTNFNFIIDIINNKFNDLFIDNNLVSMLELLIFYTTNLDKIKDILINFFNKLSIDNFKLLIDKLTERINIEDPNIYFHYLFYFQKMYDVQISEVINNNISSKYSELEQFLINDNEYNTKYFNIYTSKSLNYDYLDKYPTPFESRDISLYSINNRIIVYIKKQSDNLFLFNIINGINIPMPTIQFINNKKSIIPQSIEFKTFSNNINNNSFIQSYNNLYNKMKNINIINNLLNLNKIPYATEINYIIRDIQQINIYNIDNNIIDIVYDYTINDQRFIKKLLFNNNIIINFSDIENNNLVDMSSINLLNYYFS